MNITPQDLPRHLKQTPRNTFIYLITGDEILLVEESIKAIVSSAQLENYNERHIIESGTTDAIDHFLSHTQNLSFFSLKKIIEVRFSQKVTVEWATLLMEIAERSDANHIIIIRTPKLSKAETQTKWYKAIDKVGCILTVWPLKQGAFLHWIQSRLELANIKVPKESAALIAAHTEGNLLAASQVIEKLQLFCNNSSTLLSHETVAQILSDQTHYTVFDLSDAALAQQASQCLKILSTLKDQGIEPAIVLWALLQDIRHLATLSAVSPNERASLYPKRGIWGPRQALFQKALTHFKASSLPHLIAKARKIDEIIKGLAPGNVWIDLEMLCLALSGINAGINV